MKEKDKSSKLERELRWNIAAGESLVYETQAVTWYFVIINDSREIERIKNKIYSEFQPILSKKEIIKNEPITNSGGLHYELLKIETEKGRETLKRIYKGHIHSDPKLYERKNPIGLEEYVHDYIRKRTPK